MLPDEMEAEKNRKIIVAQADEIDILKNNIKELQEQLNVAHKRIKELTQAKLLKIYGIEDHEYAIKNAHPEVKKNIKYSEYYNLPFKNKEIDFIFAFNSIYTHNLRHTVNSLREMQRVGKKNYVVVASYENEKEKNAFLNWTVIGTTVLSKKEWLKLFRFIGYKGDYYFSTAKTLGLI